MAFPGERWALTRLITRCSKRPVDCAAWEEFVRRFHPTIQSSVSQVLSYKSGNGSGPGRELTDSVVGELVEAVYSRLIENRSQALRSVRPHQPDSMHRYLAMVSVSVVRDYVRDSGASARAS